MLINYSDNTDTWVLPLIQAGSLGVNIDSEVTHRLLATAPPLAKIKIATGYFNLIKEYADAIVKDCQADCSLLMAHPNVSSICLYFLFSLYLYAFSQIFVIFRQTVLKEPNFLQEESPMHIHYCPKSNFLTEKYLCSKRLNSFI